MKRFTFDEDYNDETIETRRSQPQNDNVNQDDQKVVKIKKNRKGRTVHKTKKKVIKKGPGFINRLTQFVKSMIKTVIIIVVLIGLAIGGYFAYDYYTNDQKETKKEITELKNKLKESENQNNQTSNDTDSNDTSTNTSTSDESNESTEDMEEETEDNEDTEINE